MKKSSMLFVSLIFLGFSNLSLAEDTSTHKHFSNIEKTTSAENTISAPFMTAALNNEFKTASSIDDENDFSYEETDYGYD